MRSKSSFEKFLICSLLVLLSACTSKNNDSEEAQPDPVKKAAQSGTFKINLDDVSSDKCLNIQKYFETVRGFPAETRFRKLTSDFRLLTGNSLPRNYYLRLAAGNFQILDTDLSQISDFAEMKQTGCESVTLATEGHSQTYPIVSSKKDSVTFKNEWGGQTTVTWVSPTSVSFDVISVVGDFLCDSGSQGKLMVTQDLTWGDDSIFTPTLSEKAIDQNFLSLVSEATGYSLNNLYSSPVAIEPPPTHDDGANNNGSGEEGGGPAAPVGMHSSFVDNPQPVAGDRQLLVSKLKELQAIPVRNELLQCY